ncbi:hypothetical protein KGG77_gp53 [Streptomyces phage Omar]|uniref:Uncharacterized protein n=1 Tax=Streptomyces phage Omar TaxID=2059882 RepID=A0A2H5BLS4_9CAUD|nr:hypothetical protein KGG77_gp53 [Streptomyces phage Omar]AUG87215.1 hypothetical protein SEA_OMAR_31 [Streptomyces phage Omar]
MEHQWGDDPADTVGGWRSEYTSPDGLIRLVVNDEEYDFHIDAKEGYRPSVMQSVLRVAARHGLELLDDEESEAEIIDDETIRIYLCPRPARTPELRVVA